MKIKIDDKYSLHSDSNCWSVKQFVGKNKDGVDQYKTLGYYTSPGNAIKSLANYEIRVAKATTFNEAILKVNEIEAKYNAILQENLAIG